MPDLQASPADAGSGLIAGEEVGALLDRRRLARVSGRGPDRSREPDDRDLRLRDDAVPVMNDERLVTCPADVLRLPVAVTSPQRVTAGAHAPADLPCRSINPAWARRTVKVSSLIIAVWPQPRPRMVPRGPWRRGGQDRDCGGAGCRADQLSQQRREPRRALFRRQLAAARRARLRRDRKPAHRAGPGQRRQAREPRPGEMGLHRGTAGDPRLEGPDLEYD